jgi:hypothetical protein
MANLNNSIRDLSWREVFAIGISCSLGWAFTWLAVGYFKEYAFGLFIYLPIVMGTVSSILFGYNNNKSRKALRQVSFGTLYIFCIGLLFFAMEGVICIIMAFPLGLLFTWIGHIIGHAIVKNKMRGTPAAVILLLLSAPALMAFESTLQPEDQLRSVTTSVEINAAPETVWRNVIAFPQLDPPEEFVFKTGIAYPINASIKGRGVGAVRHCNFSTGSFVEPVTVWDEPHLLRFSVSDQPEPLKELSFYDIHPNHLHGYWISRQGQFRLLSLPNGHTLLEGTTWYVNKIQPGIYWTLWSDYIVHKIHSRVLEHIKVLAEKE